MQVKLFWSKTKKNVTVLKAEFDKSDNKAFFSQTIYSQAVLFDL